MTATILLAWLATPAVSASPVLELQVRLDRARFSPGEIDGREGPSTRGALRAFQIARGLPPTGSADAATRQALAAVHDAPALAEYVVTAQDAAGPFVVLSDDIMEQAQLPSLGYASLAEALGERFHASPALLRQLNPGASLAREGERLRVPNVRSVGGQPAFQAARVVVDARSLSVRAESADGAVLAVYPASVGSERDPLPRGDWAVTGVARLPPFFYDPDLFWDADASHAKAKIAPGPNNPVGVAWIDLSREHYGIHGTPEPSRVGKTQSHGCIRLTNWDVEELAGAVAEGVPVILLN
jgi:lipoprotein-anchoring transpeptidase ErfK/SrfK